MTPQLLRPAGREILVFWDGTQPPRTVVYAIASPEEAQAVAALLTDCDAALVFAADVDWNRELSPWPAPRAFRGGEDFAGGADVFLRLLTEQLAPAAEAALGAKEPLRVLAGYSLAGLFALYAMFRTDRFARFAAMSSSLWYDGFAEYLAAHRPLRLPERVCLSLGDTEAKTANARLSTVELRTREAQTYFSALGCPTELIFHPGGHFADIPGRSAAGIRAALAPDLPAVDR